MNMSTTRSMRATSLVLAAAMAFSVTAQAGTATAGERRAPKAETVGGSYAVVRRIPLPPRNGLPAVPGVEWDETSWLDMQDLDKGCHAQLDPLIPGMASQVLWPSLKLAFSTGVFGGLGGGFAAVAAFTGVSFGDYAMYMGGAGASSGFGSGIATYADRYQLAKNYVQYACMQFQITQANKYGRLKGYGVIPWAGAGRMKPQKKPGAMPLTQPSEEPVTSQKEDENPPEQPAVPPM